jgi:hypothetical protein
MNARPNTPDRVNPDGSKTIRTKRACNGCGQLIGDITDEEFTAAMFGRPLPDVRRECPSCAPTAPPPACRPMRIQAGEVYCLLLDCDHDRASENDYCAEVSESTVCAIHSEMHPGFEDEHEIVTHAEPWPCQQQAAS